MYSHSDCIHEIGEFEEPLGLELTTVREGRVRDARQNVAGFTKPEIWLANADEKLECWPLRLVSPLISVMSSSETIMLPSWLFCGGTAFSSTVLTFKLMIVVGMSATSAHGRPGMPDNEPRAMLAMGKRRLDRMATVRASQRRRAGAWLS
jgi:hypothetical protein